MLPGCTPWPKSFVEYYRQKGYWKGETLDQMLREQAIYRRDHTALVSKNDRWSYHELDTRVDQLATGFHQLGIKPMDRVIVQLPNVGAFFEVCFALFRLGALPVFALPSHRTTEISYFSTFTDAVAYVIPDTFMGFDYRPLARQLHNTIPTLKQVIVAGDPAEFTALDSLHQPPIDLPKPCAEEVAFFQLSGGSTGIPKLIPRTHDDYLYSLWASAEICQLNEHSVYMVTLPVAHNFPLSSPGSLGTLYAGGKVVLSLHPSPDCAFPLIEQEHVTITALVPPLVSVWLDAAKARRHNLSSLQVIQVGGARLTSELAQRIQSTLECTLQQVYGMAEGLVNYTRLDEPEDILIHTQGKPISPDDEIRVVDDEDQVVKPGEIGHLQTRGPYTIRGYYNADEHNTRAFTSDGFYRTGDMVRITLSGHIVVEGRAKDQINRGGDKIAAEEIEHLLRQHADVQDVAVVAMPDAFLGERSCAFVIPQGTPPAEIDLTTFLRQQGIASYKIPDRIEFIDAFPQTGVGKVSKNVLRELIAQKIENSPSIES